MDMNTKENKKYKAKAEETAIYRVIALIFVAMAGFGALTLLDKYKSKLFSYIIINDKPAVSAITLIIIALAVIAALSVVYYICTRKKGKDESGKVVTSFGIMSSAVFMLDRKSTRLNSSHDV